jgi:D-serine deaminase-like pyridoxal phosphate-dependent protein
MTVVRDDVLARLLDEPVDWRFKGFPVVAGVTVGTVGDQEWNLLAGDLPLPAIVLKGSAVARNVELLARWCAERGALHAPHGKTTMAPQLWDRQLAAGAWAITVATVAQARICRAFGVPRVFLANELVEPVSLSWVRDELAADPDFDFFCLVDSTDAVATMAAALDGSERPLQVLVELGYPGGRSGCRTAREAVEVATAVSRVRELALVGVEGYESGLGRDRGPQSLAAVDAFLQSVRDLALDLDRRGLLTIRERPIVTAGGSAFFDRAAEILAGVPSPRPYDVVVRAGAYVAHDEGAYRVLSPLAGELETALELWSAVLSRPEPGLAIAGFGRRDAPFDSGYPLPHLVQGRDGLRAVGSLEIVELNDQHAFVRVRPDDPLAVGDLIGCGISHPCTAFDKWRLLPVVDDGYSVTEAVATFF